MTKANYTNHLENRLKLRNINHDLPKKIYVEAKDRYYDEETGHEIAVMEVDLYNKKREVMLAYSVESDAVNLLTVHPLKTGQKENRIQAGRWRKK
jgi:hypothetical protein